VATSILGVDGKPYLRKSFLVNTKCSIILIKASTHELVNQSIAPSTLLISVAVVRP
jgi:hypothetical protein